MDVDGGPMDVGGGPMDVGGGPMNECCGGLEVPVGCTSPAPE